MSKTLETVLLLALPASGKSEVRRYLASMSPESCRDDFHLGQTVQLDDFPYVHLMRRIDEELVALGQGRIFFYSPDRPFVDPLDWGTLTELLNEDHRDLVAKRVDRPASAGKHLFDRIDRASQQIGLPARLAAIPEAIRDKLTVRVEEEALDFLRKRQEAFPADSLEGKTLVIELARGGHDGATLPLAPPFGYAYSLAQLRPEILEKASILYVWVTPEESRRKNHERSDPNDPGSILHHGVPIEVMLNDYGCDDMAWLEEHAERPDTITLHARGRAFNVPIARFDNRVDRTTFVRKPREQWAPGEIEELHSGLARAFRSLAERRG